MSAKYRVLVGVDYPPGKRAEPGEIVADLPERSVKWMTKQGLIEPAGSAPPPDPEPAPEASEEDDK